MKLIKISLTLFGIFCLFACGGGSGSSSDIDIDDHQGANVKAFLTANVSITSHHVKAPSNAVLGGLAPSVSSNGVTTILLNRPVSNGWAKRYLNIYIKDSAVISGRYDCVSADDVYGKPPMANRDCYIRYENDNYRGIFETWASEEAQNCSVTVINAVMDDVVNSQYQDIHLSLSCSNMQHIWEHEEFKANRNKPDDADVVSSLTLNGTIKTTQKSPLEAIEKIVQTSVADLSTFGGGGIINQRISLNAPVSGPAYVIPHQFIYLENSQDDYGLAIYLNAAYDIEGVFNCISPPNHLSDPIIIENGECFITLMKKDSSNIYDYEWDSQTDNNCYINVTNAANNTSSAPWYNVSANIHCPGMVSRAVTYGLRYPTVPASISISGSLRSM